MDPSTLGKGSRFVDVSGRPVVYKDLLVPLRPEVARMLAVEHAKMGFWIEAELFADHIGLSLDDLRKFVLVEEL